ncbi:MAG TPA: chromosome segregation protein SMC [Euryarchaeota archaeon]|nr:chromosome segregation protein SMC [Euryarchaeota archaeon]
MIRVKTIHIEEFRGIRHLDLDLAGRNFGVCGPNGTGKSAVVDAIEFCLTGDITRLSGQGTAGLSVKNHAPHVDQRTHPEKANITITADVPSLGKTITIRRSVRNPKKVEITPDEAAFRNIVVELQTHPEFALSRREIVKYIITPPGQRSIDVQTLLRLDHIERLRKSFTTFSNRRRSDADEAERNRRQADTDLRTALKIDKLDRALVLEKVNEKRHILGLPVLTELTKDTSFKAGLATPKGEDKKPPLRKAVALADLEALQKALQGTEPPALVDNREAAKKVLEKLRADEQALTLARRHGFIKMGLDLVTEDACPLCDTPWKADKLREHLRKKILSAEAIEKLLNQLRNNIDAVLEALAERIQAIGRVIQYSKSLKPSVPHAETDTYLNSLKEAETVLKGFLEDHSRVVPALEAVTDSWWSPVAVQQTRIDECQAAVKALPDTSAEEEARDILSVSQDRYERLLKAAKTAKEQKAQSAVAQKVLDHYNTTATTVLEGIYDQVAQDFATYYRAINREDEEKFIGKLTLEPAKLSFDVDFYGRGLFPPGAYHSEGHQDAMGLCLYLALMKHTVGDQFTFAVLDDVLMSVDTGHRREVCRLLKKEFPNTQFILTTHDRVWLQYMKTENLISRSQSFGGWTVDSGPRVWDDHDIWTEIQNELSKDDVAKAAWLLRRYLEYTAVILADNLRARIEFRGDSHYDLADLMPHTLKRWRTLLEDGEKSATKWKLDDKKVALSAMRATAKDLIAKTNAEQWAINPSVHFNEWANLQAHEFQEVVDAFENLLEHLRCENSACKSYLYVSPRKGQPEELRCNCGGASINLKT